MAIFEKGTIFRIQKSTKMHRGISGFQTKPKMFLALNDAEYEDDPIVSLVLCTENQITSEGCYKRKNKYIILPGLCKCITNTTYIQTVEESYFDLKKILESCNTIHDTITESDFNKIYNCLEKENFLIKAEKIMGW